MINNNPKSFPQVNSSPSKDTSKRKTTAGAKLINGYALVIFKFSHSCRLKQGTKKRYSET
jgi:hypothetical protein